MATGAKTNQKWGLETSFGVEATNVNKSFGTNLEVSGLDMDNSMTPRRGIGGRNLKKMSSGVFRGSMSLKFDLCDPWVLRLICGGYAKTGTETLTLTFAEADTLPSFTIHEHVSGVNGGSDRLIKYLGCVVVDATIDAVQNEVVSVTLNIAFADVAESAGTSTAIEITTDPLTFAQAAWKKGMTAVTLTEAVHISIMQNAELKAYLGSRIPAAASFGNREYEVSTTRKVVDSTTYLQELYGAAGGPSEAGPKVADYSLVLTPEAGQTGATYTFTFDDGYVTKRSEPKREGEDIIESVTLVMTSLTVSAVTSLTEPTW